MNRHVEDALDRAPRCGVARQLRRDARKHDGGISGGDVIVMAVHDVRTERPFNVNHALRHVMRSGGESVPPLALAVPPGGR